MQASQTKRGRQEGHAQSFVISSLRHTCSFSLRVAEIYLLHCVAMYDARAATENAYELVAKSRSRYFLDKEAC